MKTNKTTSISQKALTIIGIILCLILIPILVINCILIVKSLINKDEVPNIAGTMPFIVLTDSMYPDIQSGDIIICKEVDSKDVQVGDVISFYDPEGNGLSVVTHKVAEIIEAEGKLYFRTRGTNNNTEDKLSVPADKVIAKYSGIRIPFAGHVALFMQRPEGLIICVGVPVVLMVGYDMLRRRKYDKEKQDDMDALKAELEALRAANANKEGGEASAKEESTSEK